LGFGGGNYYFSGFVVVGECYVGGGGLVGVLLFGAQLADQAVAFFGGGSATAKAEHKSPKKV
jgi:hypothetical protein